jgi:hypothetical protein
MFKIHAWGLIPIVAIEIDIFSWKHFEHNSLPVGLAALEGIKMPSLASGGRRAWLSEWLHHKSWCKGS